MKLSSLFLKDITRSIDGVIQVEKTDPSTIHHELEEYVVTKELDKHLRSFFEVLREAESKQTNDIGVWISGFFGSGKSHFLKMLAYIIENKQIDGKFPVDFFQSKILDTLFFADIKSIVGKYTTDVLLFNIDSKASATSKNNKDSIVEVCMKVFFLHLGFLSSKPWLAHQEWKLWKNNEYEFFKKNYKEKSGISWEEGRVDIDLDRKQAIQALIATKGLQISEQDASNFFDGPYQTKNYEISPESFREIVSEYCQVKGKNHRIMFMIDEVGQYIGGNSDLMLNLQTVTEELRMLGGKAWMVVTSQEAIDKVTQMDGQGHYDFSKIKGRFKTQISLSSTNVDEVIKKRLLEKTDGAKKELHTIYGEKEHHLKNMLNFTPTLDNSHYKSEGDFTDLYPLIPYQIELTKETLHQIGNVGYAGNHLARGERSLLAIFQEAIKQRKDNSLGTLIPFDVVYDAISGFIPSYIKGIFHRAEEDSRIDKKLGLRVLKILFLLKYVKNVPLTPDNITTLLIDDIETNVIALKDKVIKSLQALQTAGFINKRTDDYEFLSDEEQEIEREISKIDVEDNEIYDFIHIYFFEGEYPGKFSYDRGHDYGFKKFVDSYEKVRSNDGGSLSLQIRTPWYTDPRENETLFGTHTASITLNASTEEEQNNPMRCIQQCLRIQKYIKRHTRSDDSKKRIQQKESEMERYKTKAKDLLHEAAMTGTYRIGNNVHTVPGSTFKDICNNLLKIEFDNIYTEFKTLPTDLQGMQLESILLSKELQTRLLEGEQTLSGAHKMIITQLQTANMRKVVITLTKLHEECMQAPYGRKESDINKLVAQLWIMKHITLKYETKEIQQDDKNALEYLTKSHYKDKITLEVKQAIDSMTIRKVSDILRKVDSQHKILSDALKSTDADKIKSALFVWLRDRQDVLNSLLINYQHKPYPGKEALENFLEWLGTLKDFESPKEVFDRIIENAQIITEQSTQATIVQDFFGGKQRELRDSGYEILQMVEKITNLLSEESIAAYEQLKVIMNNPNPYNDISKISNLTKTIQGSYQQLVVESKNTIKGNIDEHIETTLGAYKDVLGKDRDQIMLLVGEKKYLVDGLKSYADLVVEEQQLYSFFESLQHKIDLLLYAAETAKPVTKGKKSKPAVIAPRILSMKMSSLMRGSEKVSSKDDVDYLADELKKALYKKLEDYDSITLLP